MNTRGSWHWRRNTTEMTHDPRSEIHCQDTTRSISRSPASDPTACRNGDDPKTSPRQQPQGRSGRRLQCSEIEAGSSTAQCPGGPPATTKAARGWFAVFRHAQDEAPVTPNAARKDLGSSVTTARQAPPSEAAANREGSPSVSEYVRTGLQTFCRLLPSERAEFERFSHRSVDGLSGSQHHQGDLAAVKARPGTDTSLANGTAASIATCRPRQTIETSWEHERSLPTVVARLRPHRSPGSSGRDAAIGEAG